MHRHFRARIVSAGLGCIALITTLTPGQAFADADSGIVKKGPVTPNAVKTAVNRNVELVIGTTAVSSTQVKLGTVTVETVDGLGHAGANYDFRLYIASTLIKNDNHTCTRYACAVQWHIDKTYAKGTVVIGRMVVPGSSDIGAPRITM